MQTISLTQGYVALVDDEDYAALMQYKWFALVQHRAYGRKVIYAKRTAPNYVKPRVISMQKQLLQPEAGLIVDHINGDGLDNRRNNLRIATPQQNTYNRAKSEGHKGKPCLSIYKGVTKKKDTATTWKSTNGEYTVIEVGKWIAGFTKEGKRHYGGSFDNEIDAAKAADKLAIALYGEFAKLNFP